MTTPTRMRLVGVAAALALLLTPTAAAWAASAPADPNLDQRIAADEPIVHGAHVISSGHVDIGPRFVDGRWTLLLHDDEHKGDPGATSVWRPLDETALHVVDAARLTVPSSDAYAFVGAAPGSTVWVVPQTQNPAVVWAGWNTQDPAVLQRIDRGATFSVDAVEGPGVLTVSLQSGDFGAPQVFWDSRVAGAQPIFVDVNTHTHANWVFTAPGTYLVRMTVAATLVDGTTASDTQTLRFAVGTDASTDDALRAVWTTTSTPDATPSATATPGAGAVAAPPSAGDPLVPVLVAAIALVSAGLVVGVVVAVVRGGRARRAVLAGRDGGDT